MPSIVRFDVATGVKMMRCHVVWYMGTLCGKTVISLSMNCYNVMVYYIANCTQWKLGYKLSKEEGP